MGLVTTRPIHRDDPGRMVRAAIGVCLLLCVLVTALILSQDPHQNLLRDVGVVEDPTGTLDIEEIERLPFVETGPSVPIGFRFNVHWLRLSIAPDPDGADVLIRLRPVVLDHITLYLPDGSGGWSRSEAGELVDAEAQSWPSLLRQSLLVPASPRPVTAYLRIDTRSPSTVFVTAFPYATALQVDVWTLGLHVLVFGMKLASILLILLTLPKRRSAVNVMFIALEGGLFVHLMVSLGYARAIFHDLSPVMLDLASGLSVSTVIALSAIFHYTFLGQFEPAGWSRKLAVVPIAFGVLGVALVMGGERQLGLLVSAVCYLCSVPANLCLLGTIRSDAPPGRQSLMIVYALYMPVYVLNFLTSVGLARVDWFYRNSVEISALANSTLFLMLVLLMNRGLNANLEEERQRIRKSAILQRAEIQRRNGQHLLTEIVAAEARDALGKLQAMLPAQGARPRATELARALTGLDEVISDRLQAGEAETGQWKTETAPFDLAETIDRLVRQHGDGTRIERSVDTPLVVVSDEGLVSVLLRHLLVNAQTYAVPGSVISLSAFRLSRDGGQVISVTVTNRVPYGYQFDPDRCFEKFYRGPASTTVSGTGLGLFICREIIQTLGGEITVAHEGRDVRFNVTLVDRA